MTLLMSLGLACHLSIPAVAQTGSSAAIVTNYRIENVLRALGLPVGKVDGVFTESSRRAFCIWREFSGQRMTRHLPSVMERVWIDAARPLRMPTYLVRGLNLNRTCQSVTWVVQDSQNDRLKLQDVFVASSGMPGYETPIGNFRIVSQVNGWQESGLYPGAMMYRPKYFNGGRALHGSATDALVKTYPASHGCVRMLHSAVDQLWNAGVGIGTAVRVYGAWQGG